MKQIDESKKVMFKAIGFTVVMFLVAAFIALILASIKNEL